jgi:hypothetical protein
MLIKPPHCGAPRRLWPSGTSAGLRLGNHEQATGTLYVGNGDKNKLRDAAWEATRGVYLQTVFSLRRTYRYSAGRAIRRQA